MTSLSKVFKSLFYFARGLINYSSATDKITDLQLFFEKGYNSYFLLFLALVNSTYTFAIAMKGYHIQQLTLYMYDELGSKINSISQLNSAEEPFQSRLFNEWENWRKDSFNKPHRRGKPEKIRIVYYVVLAAVPVAITFLIIGLYFYYVFSFSQWYSAQNLFFYTVVVIAITSLLSSIKTIEMNKKQKDTILRITS